MFPYRCVRIAPSITQNAFKLDETGLKLRAPSLFNPLLPVADSQNDLLPGIVKIFNVRGAVNHTVIVSLAASCYTSSLFKTGPAAGVLHYFNAKGFRLQFC